MGPDLPSRPRFLWDVKNAALTECKGIQVGSYISDVLRKAFHDKLPRDNSKIIPLDLQDITLQSQLYVRVIDICKKVSEEVIQFENGAVAIALAIHEYDPLSQCPIPSPSFQVSYRRPGVKKRRSGISNPVLTLRYVCIIRLLPVLKYLSPWSPLFSSGIQTLTTTSAYRFFRLWCNNKTILPMEPVEPCFKKQPTKMSPPSFALSISIKAVVVVQANPH